MKSAILLVLDGVGCGGAADAEAFGDAGANTLAHVCAHNDGLQLPNLQQLGLGHIENLKGINKVEKPQACWGRMTEQALGKDSTTGHWELCGVVPQEPFRTFPNGFPDTVIQQFCTEVGVERCYGNKPASGTGIIDEYGSRHLDTGYPIVYTSADPVFQIAAHESVIDINRLYEMCKIAYDIVAPLGVGRVIARPFVGSPNAFMRTERRRDFSVPPPSGSLLDALATADIPVYGVGKVDNLFANRGFTDCTHTRDNQHGIDEICRILDKRGGNRQYRFVFANLVDFDTHYGHRNDVSGFATALREFDARLPEITNLIADDDLLIITADHGNDPTYPGTDHSREQVPLLVTNRHLLNGDAAGIDLGERATFADVGATLADYFELKKLKNGLSFLGTLTNL